MSLMPKTHPEVNVEERLRSALLTLPGIAYVLVEGPPYRIHLVADPAQPHPPLEAAARAILAREGIKAPAPELVVSYLPGSGGERRVRFAGVSLERPRVGYAQVRVQLEWQGQQYEGAAEGEGGAPGELRVCAHATLRALEAVLAGQVTLDLVGIKGIRIFDHDLIAVLLRCPQAPDRRLIGSALVLTELERAASVAVLNATNRLLGNYLSTH